MATYVISDIHGAYDQFVEMLNKIEFDNQKDKLYILGDVLDGYKSIDTLLLVMQMIKDAPNNVFMLLGNHDIRLVNKINEASKLKSPFRQMHSVDQQFAIQTFNEYLDLDNELRKEVVNFISNLPKVIDIEVENQKYTLAHAVSTGDFYVRRRKQRMTPEDTIFIHGHVITWNYTENIKQGGIFHDTDAGVISIDCGAKGYSLDAEGYDFRLGCLRLEDKKEFYIKA